MKILVNVFHPHLYDQSKVNSRWVHELEKFRDITINLQYTNYSSWEIDVDKKQWLDDVLTYGWAYGPGGTALKGKEWVSAISAGGPADAYQAGGYNNYSMSELLKPLQQTANLIGMEFLPPYVFHRAVQAKKEEIDASASAYLAHIQDAELNPAIRLSKLLAEMEAAGANLEA
jgi:glutathione-regulated potassium-efflux system ancillary protein KefG